MKCVGTEVSKADDYNRNPSKYPYRGNVTRMVQSSLRGHVKTDASPMATRKFVEFAKSDGVGGSIEDMGQEEGTSMKIARVL